jgi:hypothetical protein
MTTVEQQAPAPMVLEAGRTDRQYWHDVWRYRELFFILAWRDVSIRYSRCIFNQRPLPAEAGRCECGSHAMRLTAPIEFRPLPAEQRQ